MKKRSITNFNFCRARCNLSCVESAVKHQPWKGLLGLYDAERRERDLLATAKLLVSMDVDGVACQPA